MSARRGSSVLLVATLALAATGLRAASAPASAPSNQELATYADALLAKTYPAGAPGAIALVVRDGQVVLRKGYGVASLELGAPSNPDGVYWIASVTKPFTAVAVMQLVERGKISLDDEIQKYLPDYPSHDAKITIEELLTHTSGIPTYAEGLTFAQRLREDLSVSQLIARFRDKPLDFPPGTKWSYSDSGYVLLGAVIEKVSGLSYGQYLQKEIFGPAGMTHSRYGVNDEVVPGRVDGYERTANGFRRARYVSLTQGYAAGSILSTVDDLAAFDRALGRNVLLKSETFERMVTPKILPDGTSTRMGLCWSVTALDGHPLYEHNGGIYGFSAHLLRMPDRHLFIAILSNDGDGAPRPESTAFFIAERAVGKTVDLGKPYELDERTLASLPGAYAFDDKVVRTLSREGGKIFLQRAMGAKYEIVATGPNELRLILAPDNRLELLRDGEGRVNAVRLLPRFGPDGGIGRKTPAP